MLKANDRVRRCLELDGVASDGSEVAAYSGTGRIRTELRGGSGSVVTDNAPRAFLSPELLAYENETLHPLARLEGLLTSRRAHYGFPGSYRHQLCLVAFPARSALPSSRDCRNTSHAPK